MRYSRLLMVLVFICPLIILAGWPGPSMAAEKDIVVVEHSTDDDDETADENANGLPAGATSVTADSLSQAVDGILGALGEGDCIKNLHFRGHGSPGNQSVGDGVNHESGKRINGHGAEWGDELKRLKDKFCEGAVIHLWGCNVGSCDAGAAKLKEIADSLGVIVKGAVNTVYAGEQEDYDGPVQEAHPDSSGPPDCIESTDDKGKKKKKELETTNESGVETNEFETGAYVYASGSHFLAESFFDVYIFPNEEMLPGDPFPPRAPGTATMLYFNGDGVIVHSDLNPGGTQALIMMGYVPNDGGGTGDEGYGMVVDVNGNGIYEDDIDVMDPTGFTGAGEHIVPVFSSIVLLVLALSMLVIAVLVIGIRMRKTA